MVLLQAVSPMEKLTEQNAGFPTIHSDSDFNQSGFINSDVHFTPDGETHLIRPSIVWTQPSQGLSSARTGACSVAIESLGEIWIIGGRMDPDPMQSGDEVPTQMVEQMFIDNKSWYPAPTLMTHAQQYCEAEIIGEEIYVVGEWNRNSNMAAQGRVQIYNISNYTWFEGSSMPSGQSRGLGGMAEEGGNLYYAGGVRNSGGTDHTNKTWRYNPTTDQWTQLAPMIHKRSSFPLVNFHGQLYAIGGTDSTSTWNRQALDYVERYDPVTNTWTNLSSLPKAMFGWGATVHHDEIILVGGYGGGAQKSTYHWNPIEDTWKKGNDIGRIGHYDLVVESLNGSIVWATGDISNNPYSSWGQVFSGDTECQNATGYHEGWVTSPVIDLRPSIDGMATPISIELQGTERPGGSLKFQYRAYSDPIALKTLDWEGDDGTINTTFPTGLNMLYLTSMANYIQYRIQINITDLENWDEPDLDSLIIEAEHAAFITSPANTIHPRGQTQFLQTSHHLSEQGEMFVDMASCDSFGAISGPWSRIYWDGTTFGESDTQGLFITSGGSINASLSNETIIDWYFDFGDLIGFSHICAKVGSDANTLNQYSHLTLMSIDRSLKVNITDLGGLEIGQAIPGGNPIDVRIMHQFPSTGEILSSGTVQARLNFNIEGTIAGGNDSITWANDTTNWTSLTLGTTDVISWNPPTDISGILNITLEARSDQPFLISSDDENSWLLLDNDAPFIYATSPENGTYLNSIADRQISVTLADTSGFISENVDTEIWVQGLDDGTDGSIPDGIPQASEYRIINHTLENNQSLWTFNLTQSDDGNADHQYVWVKLSGADKVGNTIEYGEFWWETRDAQNGVIEAITNEGNEQIWEVEREISWSISISDANAITDIMQVTIELGDDEEFGMKYEVADYSCTVLDYRINSDRLSCTHTFEGDIMTVSVSMVAGWEIDISMLDVGEMKISIKDIDGISSTSYNNMWIFSDSFDFSIDLVEDITGASTGMITNQSLVRIGDDLRLSGSITHSLSGMEYQGMLNLRWWGTLQGQSWTGGSTIEVIDGVINSTIPLPTTGGILEMSIAVMDPYETRILGTYEGPAFFIDAGAPIIMESNINDESRYHLNYIAIGVNVLEDDGWSGYLSITCQVRSTEVDWEPVTISKLPSTEFQGKFVFSFYFDFSQSGDPTQLSPEARLDCWAEGIDDSGWDLISSTGLSLNEPWMTIPLSNIGPNIELVDVVIEGKTAPGSNLRLELIVQNTGEDLTHPFNITVHTNVSGERTLIGLYTQSQIKNGQGIVKRVSLTVPEGDWTLEVMVDSDEVIWELNEDDNSFSKEYSAPVEDNMTLYIVVGVGIAVLLGLIVIVRRRKDSEMTFAAKDAPKIEDLPRGGPPQELRRKGEATPSEKPKKGPPPVAKPENVPVDQPSADVSEAISKLSLDNLPGRKDPQPQSVPSFENLPSGGEYVYLAEGTFYSGESCGRWLLEEDGSFTNVE